MTAAVVILTVATGLVAAVADLISALTAWRAARSNRGGRPPGTTSDADHSDSGEEDERA